MSKQNETINKRIEITKKESNRNFGFESRISSLKNSLEFNSRFEQVEENFSKL